MSNDENVNNEEEQYSIWNENYMPDQQIEITKFKKGDRITRVIPATIPYGSAYTEDQSFIGTELIFLGLANGCIHLERATKIEKLLFGAIVKLPLFFWADGWVYFEKPEFLDQSSDPLAAIDYELNAQYEKVLEDQLKKAEEDNNFEQARKIKTTLDEIKKQRAEFKKQYPLPNLDFLKLFKPREEDEDDDEPEI